MQTDIKNAAIVSIAFIKVISFNTNNIQQGTFLLTEAIRKVPFFSDGLAAVAYYIVKMVKTILKKSYLSKRLEEDLPLVEHKGLGNSKEKLTSYLLPACHLTSNDFESSPKTFQKLCNFGILSDGGRH